MATSDSIYAASSALCEDVLYMTTLLSMVTDALKDAPDPHWLWVMRRALEAVDQSQQKLEICINQEVIPRLRDMEAVTKGRVVVLG